MKTFIHQSVIPASPEDLMVFHQDRGAFRRLNPPPMRVQILRDERTSLTTGELEFILWFGPFPIRWVAVHGPGSTPTSFIDQMATGPMAFWVHEHIFEAVDGRARLTDRVTYAHPPGLLGLFTRLLFGGLPLRLFFAYRHLVTRRLIAKTLASAGVMEHPGSR